MLVSSSRRTALLDWVAAIGLAGPVILMLDVLDDRPLVFTLLLGGAIALAVASWIVWRRVLRLERASAVVFAVATVGILVVGDQPLAFGGPWVACLVLARTFGAVAALCYTAALSLLIGALHFAVGNSWDSILVEGLSVAVITGFGTAFALVVHDGERVERERERLHEEREVTLARLEDAHAELQRRLGSEQDLVLAQERERAARELHDGLGHRLTAIGLALEFAERMGARDPERARQELVRARTSVSEALDAMRRTVRAMHPVELGSLRGTAAFAAIADSFRSTGVDVRVTVDGDQELSHEQSLLLLRVIQEGLTNVVRHADARHVDVHVGVTPVSVETSIEDFGAGPAPAAEEGFGLRSLRARAELLGGQFEAHPTAHGFALRIVLPTDAREAVAA